MEIEEVETRFVHINRWPRQRVGSDRLRSLVAKRVDRRHFVHRRIVDTSAGETCVVYTRLR